MPQDTPEDFNAGVDTSLITTAVMGLAEQLDAMAKEGRLAEGLMIGSVLIVAETTAPNRPTDLVVNWNGPGGRPASRHVILGMLEGARDLITRQMPL